MEGRPLEESELIAKARGGDVHAFEALVRVYQSIAVRTAFLITGSSGDAEDAAQEGFVKAYYALDRFREGAPFRPWILRIVANEARNKRRSAARRVQLAIRLSEGDPSGGAAPSPESIALANDRKRQLLKSVDGLREEERLVVTCRYFLDLSEQETSQVLGIRKGTVKSRSSRALARLEKKLAEGNNDDA